MVGPKGVERREDEARKGTWRCGGCGKAGGGDANREGRGLVGVGKGRCGKLLPARRVSAGMVRSLRRYLAAVAEDRTKDESGGA